MNPQLTVKESPILFSAAMVRALLADKKTQTRRVVKPQPIAPLSCDLLTGEWVYSLHDDDASWRCPYGQPGDRLWVRETWCQPCYSGSGFNHPSYKYDALYAADDGRERHTLSGNWTQNNRDFKWRPSIHMPRLFSRITLEIVSVRVERLQDISEADALAEGAFLGRCPCMPRRADRTPMDMAFRQIGCHIHGHEFFHLWDSINGKRPGCAFADNPWVWVVEFKREANHAE